MSDFKVVIQTPQPIKVTIDPPAPIKAILQVGQGPAGVSGASAPPFVFNTPQTNWVINHNLGRRPLVGVFSVGGVEMWAEIVQVSLNQLIVYFDSPTAGYAICS